MSLLRDAVEYANTHGDYNWFCEVYTRYRETHSEAESVILSMTWLYGADNPYVKGLTIRTSEV